MKRVCKRSWRDVTRSILTRTATLTALLLLLNAPDTQAMLRSGPRIESVAIDPQNPDALYFRASFGLFACGDDHEAAISTNGGRTFMTSPRTEIPDGWTTNLQSGIRRYVLVDSYNILRSDDGGLTWTNTAAISFIRTRSTRDCREAERYFWSEYGKRLPWQSPFWNLLFTTFASVHFLLIAVFCRRHELLPSVLTALRGVLVVVLLWTLLWGFHAVVHSWVDNQYSTAYGHYALAYWNTSAAMHPSAKLGLAMAIAARPLPLLVYLLLLWPILPGAVDVMSGPSKRFHPLALIIAIVAGTAFVAFHLWMMFVGYFWE